ncbi:hypothetical protein [Pyrolobus fumarii]|nr:hypothetical protein [Pyrolobus fumarii]
MDTTITPGRPRGRKVIILLDHLLASGEKGATAAELAHVAGIASKQVYPLLRWWIEKRVVIVEKVGWLNIYKLNTRIKRALEKLLRIILRSREARVASLAQRLAEHKLLRRLSPVEKEILALLAERILSGSPYLRIHAENPRQALDILKVKLESRFRALGLNPNEISALLLETDEALNELNEAGLVYMAWDTRNHTLILRLDKSLEEELHQLL